MEAKIAMSSGLNFESIQAGKFRRLNGVSKLKQIFDLSTLGLNAKDTVRVARGIITSIKILKSWKPDVVFIKGGYVGLPVGIAAHILSIPYVIHESDFVPGLTNRILSRWAEKIAVGFPVKGYQNLPKNRLEYTGNPVRSELSPKHRLEGIQTFKLSSDLPILLVTGGSQGAQAINDCVIKAIPQLVKFTQVIHLTGDMDFERIRYELTKLGKIENIDRYQAHAFLQDKMSEALSVADIVVARAGANTISELAYLGKPCVLIPNYLYAGHQEANARLLSRAGAVTVIDERKLTPEALINIVRNLFGSEEEQQRLSKNISTFSKPDAAKELAQLIIDSARPKVGEHKE